MRRLATSLLLAGALLLAPAAARAILYIDINAPGGKRMPVALPAFVAVSGDPSLSAAIPKVIADDLRMTALFEVLPADSYLEKIVPAHFAGKPLSFPDWKMIGAEAVVVGKVEARGEQIAVEMRLYDSTLGNMMAGRPAASVRSPTSSPTRSCTPLPASGGSSTRRSPSPRRRGEGGTRRSTSSGWTARSRGGSPTTGASTSSPGGRRTGARWPTRPSRRDSPSSTCATCRTARSGRW